MFEVAWCLLLTGTVLVMPASARYQCVVAMAFPAAELIQDTPKALYRLILPTPIRQSGSAVRSIRI